MREPKLIQVSGQISSAISTEDLLQIIEYFTERHNFEDPKEAAIELDLRGASKISERVSEVNKAIDRLYEEVQRVKADPNYKTHDYCELCREWYPKGAHVPSEKCLEASM